VSIRIDQKKITDFQTLQDAVQGTSMEVVQTERGAMTGTLTHLSAGPVGISAADFSRGFRGRGVQSKRNWTISNNAKPVAIQGFAVRPDDLFLLAPGQEIYASYANANSYTVALIEPDELFARLENQKTGAADAAIWRRPASVLRVNPKRAADRAETLRALLETINDKETMSADTAAYYRRELLELVIAPLLDDDIDHSPRFPTSTAKLVREVDRYLVDNSHRLPHISELIEVFKVPERTLFHAYNNEHGIGPKTFLRNKRLCDVRTALKRGEGSVKQIAVAHGFFQQGKFAGIYWELFDEKPSETHRRWQTRHCRSESLMMSTTPLRT